MRRVMFLVLAAMMLPASAAAQSPTTPTPWAAYRADAQTFVDAFPTASPPVFTVETFQSQLEGAIVKWQAELERLATIVPEPCYADAHAAYLAFRTDELANYRDALPLIAAADSQMGVLGVVMMVQGMLAQAHPLAFPEPSAKPGVVTMGPVLDALHVIDTLQVCVPT
jgi:hypothetical protein